MLSKENQEKDGRIRQLLNLNSEQNQETSLFSNLTAEIQKQTSSLQKLVNEREIARSYYKNKTPETYYKEKITVFSKEIDKISAEKFADSSNISEKNTNLIKETKIEPKHEVKIENKVQENDAAHKIFNDASVFPVPPLSSVIDKSNENLEIPQKENEVKEPEPIKITNASQISLVSEKTQKIETKQEEKERALKLPEKVSGPMQVPPPNNVGVKAPPPPQKKAESNQKANYNLNENFMHPKLNRPAPKTNTTENKASNIFKRKLNKKKNKNSFEIQNFIF